MASKKCLNCGGELEYVFPKGYVCAYCGNINNELTESEITNGNELTLLLEECKFKQVSEKCKAVLETDPDNPEINWYALLAEYQVVYLQNDEGVYKPTFLNPYTEIPINESSYYAKLSKNFKLLADDIETTRKITLNGLKSVQAYNVFLSYKQHVNKNSSQETPEAEWANRIYSLLSKQKGKDELSVFYDKVSLNGQAGWEPHIYSAIKSAEIMVIFASSVENVNSTWVKNEWIRFTKLCEDNPQKTYLVVGDKFDRNLPEILRAKQFISVNEAGWEEKVINEVNKANGKVYGIDYIMDEAKSLIIQKKFKAANEKYDDVLSINGFYHGAYWGKLKCKLKAFDDYDLVKTRKNITEFKEYKSALKCSESDMRSHSHYEQVAKDRLNKNLFEYKDNRKNYEAYLKNSKVQRAFKKIAVVAAVLLIGAFGVYSYFGISNPVSYTVEGNEATLSGKSIYFNLVVKDLEVDTYKDSPVVKIGDGVFKGSKLKTVTLSDSVKEIGDNAFENSKDLTTVTIENCIYIGANAFSGCTSLTEIKIGASDTTVISENAFANVNKNLTISVPSVSESVIAKLKAEYPDLKIETYTQDSVQECTYFIAKLNSLSNESEADIQKAESLYNALSAEEKAKVTNYGVLQNARLTYDAVTAINAIGTVTLDSTNAITNAENLYTALTTEQKQTVSNYSTLTTARAVYNVMSQIAGIGEVQINSESKIADAEAAYLALTYEQRDLVTNYSALTSARVQVDTLLANDVITKITAIGIVTADSDSLITVAEAAYNNLSQSQKERVSNYDTLTDARAVYNATNAIANIGTITSNSQSPISVAQTLYDGLTSAQKLKVLNYSDLTDAVAVLPVVSQIGAIGTITASSLSVIERAEAAYAGLSAMQQTKVSNYTALTDSRTAYTTVTLIEDIGTVSEDDLSKVEAAKSSYDSLSSAQQSIVGNYSKLSDALKVYNTITSINGIGSISLESSAKILSAESLYNELSSEQKQLITNYGLLRTARDIYNLELTIKDLGELVLGNGDNYRFKTLTINNMVAELNNTESRRAVDSVTRDGFNLFTSSVSDTLYSVFPNFEIIRYDLSKQQSSNATYNIPSDCASIGLIGNTTFTYSNSQIRFESRLSNVKLELCNFNITAPDGKSAIDASAVPLQYTVTIGFVGTCTVLGGTGSKGSSGSNFSPTNSDRSGTAGSGYQGGSGASGINGNAVKITVASTAMVTVTGGVGGQGGTGGNSACYSKGLSGRGKLGAGGVGGQGGTGGDGINVTSLNIVNSGSINIIGGQGGTGGTGGKGADDCDQDSAEPDDGGNGGQGGVGGTGGYGIKADSIIVTNNKISVTGGQGGQGGQGGDGGTGDTCKPLYPNGSWGGDGGQGGDGGTGGISIDITCNNATLTAGKGGAVGSGGAFGINRHNSSRPGDPGKDGANVGADGAR